MPQNRRSHFFCAIPAPRPPPPVSAPPQPPQPCPQRTFPQRAMLQAAALLVAADLEVEVAALAAGPLLEAYQRLAGRAPPPRPRARGPGLATERDEAEDGQAAGGAGPGSAWPV